MIAETNQGGRYASAANTDVAKQVSSVEETMSANIVPNFDRDTFMSQMDRLDPITQQAFVMFLNRLITMTDEAILDLTHRMGTIKWQQPDELRLIGLLVVMTEDESVQTEEK